MFCLERRDPSIVEMLQLKLKAVTKLKMCLEKQICKLRSTERCHREELHLAKSEIDLLTEQLEDLKDKISDIMIKISIAEIQKIEEESKIEIYLTNLNCHKKGFEEMFAEERNQSELRNKELRDRLAEEQELHQQKQNEIDQKIQLQIRQATALEDECVVIERECTVLKKRNNAIMLKLRRKLVEAEDERRELLTKQISLTKDNSMEQ